MPTPYKLVYLTPASEDFEEIIKFHVTKVGVEQARKIYDSMINTITRLADYPLMGQTHPDSALARQQFRKLVLTKTYVAIYRVIDDTVYIYRIVNGKTNYPNLLK